MRTPTIRHTSAFGFLMVCWFGWSSIAAANNIELVPLGDQAALLGRAVVASSRDAGSLWYNPAGLSWMSSNSVNLSGSAFVLRVGDLDKLFELRLDDRSEYKDEVFVGLISLPSALIYVRKLGDGVTGAFGMFVPFALDVTLRRADTFASPDFGQTDWGFEALSQVKDYRLGGGVGMRMNNRLRLGASLFATYRSENTLLQAWSFGDLTDRSKTTDFFQIDTFRQDFGTQATLGAQYKVHPEVQVGLSLRAPVLRVYEETEENQLVIGSRADIADIFNYTPQHNDGWSLKIQESAAARLGVEWSIHDFSLNIEGEYRTGSGTFEDTFNARFGGGLFVRNDLIIGLGGFVDHSQAKDLSSGDFTADYYGGSLGVRFGELGGVGPEGETRFHTTISVNYALGFGRIGEVTFQPNAEKPIDLASSDEIRTVNHDVGLYIGSGIEF